MRGWLFLILAAPVFAQPGTITTAAGAYPYGEGVPARQGVLLNPHGIARDPAGHLYICDQSANRIRRISPDGVMSTFAGTGVRRPFDSPALNGPAALAPIGLPRDVATDGSGNVYFIDADLIRKVTPNGLISTVAGRTYLPGDPNPLLSGDGGPATQATLSGPLGLAADDAGNIYISDTNNGRVRKVDNSGIITTIAGRGGPGIAEASSGDGGPARDAQVAPQYIAVDAAGNVYFGDRLANTIRRIGVDGNITAVATQNVSGLSPVAVDDAGAVYFVAAGVIRRLTRSGANEFVAGNTAGTGADGAPASQAKIVPAGIVVAPDGSVFFTSGTQVKRLTPQATVVTVGGVPANAGDGGPGPFSRVSNGINQLSVDSTGALLIVDSSAFRIRRLSADGIITSIAGNGFGDFAPAAVGPATSLGISGNTIGVTSDAQGNVYLLNSVNALMRISPDGVMRLFAQLNGNGGLASDAAGNVYAVEQNQSRVRRIAPDGTVTTFAGNGIAGFSGDGGPAAQAQLRSPRAVAVAPNGDVYIGDNGNNRIRRVSNGMITTVAGGGQFPSPHEGPALQLFLNPRWLGLDTKGNLYFSELQRVKKLTPGGAVSVVAGGAATGFSGDGGPATQARFDRIEGVAVDPNGNIFVADANNRRVRRIEGASPFAFTPRALLYAFALGAPAARQTLTISSFDGDPRGFRLEANVPWLTFAPANGNVTGPLAIGVTANPASLASGTYAAQIRIVDTRTTEFTVVPVTLTISRTAQQLRLSQVGLTFAARAGGSAPPGQSFQVINSGVGPMDWAASVSTIDGGPWLAASPANGTSVAGGASPPVNVTINPAGLAAGVYHGLVTITAAGADNSPQSAVVLLNVLPANQQPGPVVDPSGLIFTAAPGGSNPAIQRIQLSNISGRAINYNTAIDLRGGPAWFARAPTSGAIQPGQGVAVEIRPALGVTAAGSYPAELSITFTPDNVTIRVALLLVVSAGAAASSSKEASADCAATRLLPVFRSPNGGYAATAGWPTPVEVQVVDDCGQPLSSGSVVTEFSNGDAALFFTGTGAGRWSATWAARGVDAGVRVKAIATNPAGIRGESEITVGVRDTADQPAVSRGGVVSAASFRTLEPLAPGSYVSIFGSKFSPEVKLAESLPLPLQLGDTIAVLGGRTLPLNLTSNGQVNAILPYNVADNTTVQLIVRRGRAYSLPEPVLTSTAQPAVFTVDGSGGGPGHIYVFTPGGYVLADAARPATAGDVLLLYVTGMGPVDQPVRAGDPAPSDPLARVVGQVSVTIKGREAKLLFAGLAPGFAGVYQVNVEVPEGIDSDAAAALIVEVNGQGSAPVTMAVRM